MIRVHYRHDNLHEHDRGRDPGHDPIQGGRVVNYTAGFGREGDSAVAFSGDSILFSTASGVVVADPSHRRSFPSRESIRAAAHHRLGDIMRLLLHASWWDAESIRDGELLAHYENVDGLFPEGLPASVARSWEFYRRCLVPAGDLMPVRNGKPAIFKHIMSAYARFACMPCAEPIPTSYGVDLYCYRTFGEVEHVELLRLLDTPIWVGVRDVAQDALCLPRPILRAEFRYTSNSDTPYWTWVKCERCIWRNDGLLVSYHCTEYQNFRPHRRVGRWPSIPPGWDDVEVPPHCYADLPPVLAYMGSRLIGDVFSGWWCVFYTGYAAHVAAFVLWDVYDRHQLWRLHSTLIEWIRRLELTEELGSPMNQGDLHFLLEVIENLDWSTGEVIDIPAAQRSEAAPAPQTEFIWHDPWRRERIDKAAALAMRKRGGRSVMPYVHSTGFVVDPPLPPLMVRQLSWTLGRARLIPASHFYEEEHGEVVYAGPPVNEHWGMELDRPPTKLRRESNELREFTPGAGSCSVRPVRARKPPREEHPARDDATKRATGVFVGTLNIPAADDLSAEIAALVSARMAASQAPPEAIASEAVAAAVVANSGEGGGLVLAVPAPPATSHTDDVAMAEPDAEEEAAGTSTKWFARLSKSRVR